MVKFALNAAQIFPKACNYCPNANFVNTSKLCKKPSSHKANFNSCFPYSVQTESWHCRVQKHNIRIHRKPQLCNDKVLLTNIYLPKKNLQFQTTVKNLPQTRNQPHLLKWNKSITHHQGTHSHSFNLQFTITQRHSPCKSSRVPSTSTENSLHPSTGHTLHD